MYLPKYPIADFLVAMFLLLLKDAEVRMKRANGQDGYISFQDWMTACTPGFRGPEFHQQAKFF